MYHSMTIEEKHTFRDFGLIPVSRPVVNPPQPNYSFLEVPGANGSLDISEAVCGNITYADRTGSFEFYVKNGRNWVDVYAEIMSYLHGKRLTVTLDDDPAYFYVGRISVNQWKSDKNNSFLTLDYQLEPFKYEVTDITSVPWAVNCAADGLGWQMAGAMIDTPTMCTLSPGGAMPYVPVFWVSQITELFTAEVNGKIYTLSEGKNRIPEVQVSKTNVEIYLSGNAQIEVYTRWGWL